MGDERHRAAYLVPQMLTAKVCPMLSAMVYSPFSAHSDEMSYEYVSDAVVVYWNWHSALASH